MDPPRIKVIHIMTRLVVGGAQDTALATCASADPARFDQTLVVGPQTGPEGDLFAEAERIGVRVIVVPSIVRELSPPGDARAVVDLARLLRRERPGIVHTHSSKAGILGRVAARWARVPRVVHSVHGWSFHDYMSRPVRYGCVAAERTMAHLTDSFVVENDSDHQKGISSRIGPPDRYVLIRNGVNPDLYPGATPADSELRAAVRRELGLPGHAVVVGSVIRLTTQKNPEGLVRAAALVMAGCPGCHLVIVGDGPLRAATEVMVAELGLEGRILFTGIRRDVPRLLAGFDIFALSSRWEGLPRVLLEAMAAGVPVVAPRVDGIMEAIEDGVSGTLVTPDNPECLAAGILALIEDRPRAQRYQKAARATVEKLFDSRRMTDQLQQLYASLDRRPPRRPVR